MTTLREGAIEFEFPDDWTASKYDEWTFYRRQFRNVCGGAKAMDFVVLQPNSTLWLIEVKDYRQEPRLKSIELAAEISVKVRDTLAGLVAAHVRANEPSEQRLARRALQARKIRVVLHLEQPFRPTRLHPIEDVTKVTQKLKQLLRAIDPHPRVTNVGAGHRFGWTTRNSTA